MADGRPIGIRVWGVVRHGAERSGIERRAPRVVGRRKIVPERVVDETDDLVAAVSERHR
jgi:hypothetical protein